jgi:hypothetical protein
MFIGLGLWMLSCEPEYISNRDTGTFFDLEDYVHQILADSIHATVIKTAQANHKPEQQKLENYPLWKDIEHFSQYNINKPALFDKYQVDTIIEGSLVHINYRSLSEKLHVQELDIWRQNESIDSIWIHSSLKSFIEESHLKIRWVPRKGYVIDKTVIGRFSKEKNQQISVQVM